MGGVVLKLTEDTWVQELQMRRTKFVMHRLRGLQVSIPFSRYTSEEAARAEAQFYIADAQRLNFQRIPSWSMTLRMPDATKH